MSISKSTQCGDFRSFFLQYKCFGWRSKSHFLFNALCFKNTQSEDSYVYTRIHAAIGRRIYRRIQLERLTTIAAAQPSSVSDDAGVSEGVDASREIVSQVAQELQEDYIEGLGRILTGVNAALSRYVVSSTMAHLLICQKGSRFSFSHGFSNILLTQMESALEKENVNFAVRCNRGKRGALVRWPDSSCDDYIY
jgi:hypothetical protein